MTGLSVSSNTQQSLSKSCVSSYVVEQDKIREKLNPLQSITNLLGFAAIRSSFAICSMTIQTLKVNKHPIQASIFKPVFRHAFLTQVMLNSAMASTSIGIYALGVNKVTNNEAYKVFSISFGQLCLMQPIYNNIINGVQNQILKTPTTYKFLPELKTVPFIMFRESVSIGCGVVIANKLQAFLVNRYDVGDLKAAFFSGSAVGMLAATITQPVHNCVTYHVSKQKEGSLNTILEHSKQFLKANKSRAVTIGLLARYMMVIPTIVSMNVCLSPIYNQLSD